MNKKQTDNETIQNIISYYQQEKYERELEPNETPNKKWLGALRLSDGGCLEICNGFICGQPRWTRVPLDLL